MGNAKPTKGTLKRGPFVSLLSCAVRTHADSSQQDSQKCARCRRLPCCFVARLSRPIFSGKQQSVGHVPSSRAVDRLSQKWSPPSRWVSVRSNPCESGIDVTA